MPAVRREKQNCVGAQKCEVCGSELSEKQVRAGIDLCGQGCAQELDRRSGRSPKQIQNALRADAPSSLPADELSPAAVRCLRRHPKVREFFLHEVKRMEHDPVSVMLSFVDAWESGTLVATTDEARRAAARTAEWYRAILQGPDEKGNVERVMGLRAVGRDPALQAARDRFRDEDLFSEMIQLMSLGWGLDIAIEEAAKMVSALCERTYPAQACAEWGITPWDKLARRFKRSKIGNCDFVALFAELEPLTLQEARQLINKFPQNSRPLRLQKFI